MSNFVLVIDTNKKPLVPCHPSVARKLLRDGKAAVFRRYPRGKGNGIGKGREEGKGKRGRPTTSVAERSGRSKREIVARSKKDSKRSATLRGQQLRVVSLIPFSPLSQSHSLSLFGTGGRTKYNRCRLNFAKTHWLDAACVGNVNQLQLATFKPLLIKATGHGTRQMCRTDKFGFPCRYVPRNKFVKGFQTGDIVEATVTKGKKIGNYAGRIAVRSTGSFNISTKNGLIQGISYKYCQFIHRKDGYDYIL